MFSGAIICKIVIMTLDIAHVLSDDSTIEVWIIANYDINQFYCRLITSE